ncbi:hypothetical protein [Rhodanobacter thiooxydans]|uniref:hypothetical protein n=1 Tax=Rhodanobacter thiooxydans TaxID=416169 RepID=UPI000260DE34|nr:hypothetical protein [Rhodanobacter thiooxydans]EIL99147.1 curculin-like (mannose-binding) lectin protein [Rhodanobacter thiooxydans LCS2]
MPIQVTDIQLLASERLTDTDDGGGKMTGTVIESGAINNLFPDISRLDRTYGRLSLRKAFMSVRSQNTDTYLGAHVIVTDPPSDDKVAVTMFTTGSPTDVRSNAQDRIESYLTVGPLNAYYVFGNQPQGAKAITLFGRVEDALPEVGDVLVISVESGNVVTAQQYVRIGDVKAEIRNFTDSQGDYTRKVLTLTLTSALRQTYLGAEASRLSSVVPPTRIRSVTVADASTYYGVSKLAAPAAANDLQVTVESITAQLVPSTTREVAVAGATPGLSLSYIAAAVAQALNTGASPRYQMRGVLPGSLQATTSSGTAKDDGAGNMQVGTSSVGAVDYESGRLSGPTINGGTYIPAATISAASKTFAVGITLSSQGTVYVVTLPSIPAPGTLSVSFRYLGKWYTLTDAKRDGTIAGSSIAAGGGTVDYTSGDVTMTLGAIPDVGSKLVYAWGDPTSFQQHAGDLTVTDPVLMFQVAHWPIKPGTLTLSWLSGGVTKTATADSGGTISGNAIGNVIYLDGTIVMAPAAGAFPDSNAKITTVYTQADGLKSSVVGAYAGGTLTFDLPAGALPVKPGGLSGVVAGFFGATSYSMYWKDDGAGGIVTAAELAPKYRRTNGSTGQLPIISVNAGTVDYSTGHVIIQPGSVWSREYTVTGVRQLPNSSQAYTYTYLSGTWQVTDGQGNFVPSPLVQFNAVRTTATETAQNEAIDYPGISFVLSRTVVDPILPGSVWFTWGGKTYIDRQGKIFRDMDPATGSATQAGTINYQTGEVTLTDYGTSTGGSVALKSLVTQFGIMPTSYAVFRTPGAPLRPSSFYVQAIRTDTGETITATSNNGGVITGTFIGGTVQNDMGWAEINFGSFVPAAGNETQPWYNAANVVGSNVWRPIFVDPTTIKFNCVVQTTLPLNADLLGIDPVRLPLTGRVPIFRDGDVVVIHDDRVVNLSGGFTAGSTFTLPDAPISQFALVDATGAVVPISNYTVDMTTATVTGATGYDVSGFTAPISCAYTVDDMLLASSVELGGQVSLVAPLSRAYPAGAKVSSVLLFGDLQGQNPVFFSQQTWTGAWSDSLIGAGTTAQYNRTVYPLQFVNADTVTERWSLIFTSSASGNIVGETLGQIGTFTTSIDIAPINPITGAPYFTLKSAGFGAGWGVSNVIRFNTIGPNAPIWIARTVLPGAQAVIDDAFRLQLRGDAT